MYMDSSKTSEKVKICTKCNDEKSLLLFNKGSGKFGRRSICRDCCMKSSKQRYYSDPERSRVNGVRWRAANPDRTRGFEWKKKFWPHLSVDEAISEYAKLFSAQEGRCRICKKHKSELTQGLSVDHCHRTNKIRGLLCGNCNRGIGIFFDDSALLKTASEYIMETK